MMSGSMGECNNCADQAIFHEGLDCFFGEASYVNLLLNFTLYAYSLAPTLTWICPRGVELQTSPTLTGSAHSAVTICIKYSLLSTVNTHTSPLTQSRSARVTPCEPLRWTVSTAIAMTHIVYDLDSRQSKNCRGWGVIPDESSLAKEKY